MDNVSKQKFFLYARKSTDEADRQVLSIETQLTEVREFAEKEDLLVIREFIEKQSAKQPGRKVFNQLLVGIETREATGILAWYPNRLARNAVDAGKIIHLLDTGKLQTLKFPTFWFDKTPQGPFMLNIAFGQGKYYIDNLAENIKRGLRQKLRKGIYPGKAQLGYLKKLDDHTIIENIENPENWRKVKKVFKDYANGKHTLEDLRKLALSFGLVSFRSKKKSSNTTLH